MSLDTVAVDSIDSVASQITKINTAQKLINQSRIKEEIGMMNREIDYQTILELVLSDRSNFRLIIPDILYKPVPDTILVNRNTKRWHKNRFCISAKDSLEYVENPEGNFNYPFNVHYIFRGQLVNLISQAEKEAMESFATNIPPETISIQNPTPINLVDSSLTSANAIHVQFSKPIYSKNGKYLFVDYTMYYNDHRGEETSFSSPIYSYNFIIFKSTEDNHFIKVEHDDYLFY